MAHTVTLIQLQSGPRAEEILEGVAARLCVPHIWQDGTRRAQVELQFDPEHALDAIIDALDETAADWRDYVSVKPPRSG